MAGCYQDTTQTDEIGGRGVPGGVFTRPQAGVYEANRRVAAALRPSGLLCRRGQSNPRRSAEYPQKTLIQWLDAIRIPPSPIRQRIPKPLVLAHFWVLFVRTKSTPGRGAGSPAKGRGRAGPQKGGPRSPAKPPYASHLSMSCLIWSAKFPRSRLARPLLRTMTSWRSLPMATRRW